MGQLTDADRAAWIQRHTFVCPVYRARISPQQCAANRHRPMADNQSSEAWGDDGGRGVAPRKRGCGDDCPAWLSQRNANTAQSRPDCSTRRGTCAYCERENMALITGMCGPCGKRAARVRRRG